VTILAKRFLSEGDTITLVLGDTSKGSKGIRAQTFVLPVTLGPRIMRADTAALAALSVFQSIAGDWASAL